VQGGIWGRNFKVAWSNSPEKRGEHAAKHGADWRGKEGSNTSVEGGKDLYKEKFGTIGFQKRAFRGENIAENWEVPVKKGLQERG